MQLGLAVIKYLSGEEDKAKRRQVLGSMLFAITIVSVIFAFLANLFATDFRSFSLIVQILRFYKANHNMDNSQCLF